MRDEIEDGFGDFRRTGSTLAFQLPSILQSQDGRDPESATPSDSSSSDDDEDSDSGALSSGSSDTEDDEKEHTPVPAWHKVNPDVEPEWRLPVGKTFNDYFKRGSPNLSKFPKFSHHVWPRETFLCLKYQASGECVRGSHCQLAHVPKSKMSAAQANTLDSAFRDAYGS